MYKQLDNYQVYPINFSVEFAMDRLAKASKGWIGVCPVCGYPTIFYRFTADFRESGVCIHCRSFNRQRQMAQTLLKAIHKKTGVEVTSLRKLVQLAKRDEVLGELKIFNTETTGPIHGYLSKMCGYVASEYLGPEYKSGSVINGVLHQDLMASSFDSQSFDFVLSSDVFEHIPEPYWGFQEIHRILKPQGEHIFTVPFHADGYLDEVRATLDEKGELVHRLPPIYHADPVRPEGIIVFVIFSTEMLLKLHNLGFVTKAMNMRSVMRGILGSNALVFQSIKISPET